MLDGEQFAALARRLVGRARAALAGHDPYDIAVAVLAIVLVTAVSATLKSYAISNDEEVQQRYGELIVAYYLSGFRDQALFHYSNLYLYGGLFDVIAVLAERALPFLDAYLVRHILSSLTGLAGIAGAWAAARLIAGPRAGAIAAFALAVSGCWYGAMFNHTKDIPFAAAMIWAIYFLLRTARELPQPRWRNVNAFGLLLGAALGIRVLGLLLVGYAAFAILTRLMQRREAPRGQLQFFADSAIAFAPAFLIGYAIMLLAWPWSSLSPLNPIRGLIDFSHFHYQIRTVLDGQIYTMATVPRWYVPAYLLIRLPLLVLAGTGIALALAAWRNRRATGERRSETLLLASMALFPIACEVIDKGPAFTGLRHFLFVVPVFAALAGIGFDDLLSRLNTHAPRIARSAFALVLVMLTWNAAKLVRLHPYENLFYNPLVGGLPGAAGRYATDYWVGIMPEAVDRLENYVAMLDRRGAHPERYRVAVCGERLPFEKRANSRLEWTDDWTKAEFFIAPTHMNCDRVLNGYEFATIARLGTRIGVVKDRRALLHSEVRR
ncbi:MAG TPA: glycosyltransferase family 39 protein [Pseudolabrys sp.]|jgi:hypothetical protein|nr:glycosyltransferase family 39 protein [Pseudolabrys sp.]